MPTSLTEWLNSNNHELSRVSLQGSFNKSHHSRPASLVTGHCPADWSQRSLLFQIQQEESMKNVASYLQAVRPAKTLQRLSLHLVISDLQGLREGNCLGLHVLTHCPKHPINVININSYTPCNNSRVQIFTQWCHCQWPDAQDNPQLQKWARRCHQKGSLSSDWRNVGTRTNWDCGIRGISEALDLGKSAAFQRACFVIK